MSLRDARTGKPLCTMPSVEAADGGGDKGEGPGRGVAFDIDPRYPGAESWTAGAGMSGMWDAKGKRFVGRRPPARQLRRLVGRRPARELLDQNHITKWNWQTQTTDRTARRAGLHVEQRHQGDAVAVRATSVATGARK